MHQSKNNVNIENRISEAPRHSVSKHRFAQALAISLLVGAAVFSSTLIMVAVIAAILRLAGVL